MIAALGNLSVASYQRHDLHAPHRLWTEKNCYIDVWIELVHALNLDPHAMLPFALAIDFTADQFTFFKPPHAELLHLYGIDVQELNVWRPLIDHVEAHLAEGRLICTEADAWWLPDTSGTDYRRQHTKSTIIIEHVDREKHQLGYFHNASYYGLEGEDFVQLFAPVSMPLFAEVVRVDRLIRRAPADLREASLQLLRHHFARRPLTNPVQRFAERFAQELAQIRERGIGFYHQWAFATIRQLGAASELIAAHLRWLQAGGVDGFEPAAQCFFALSEDAKMLILKGARAASTQRPFDAVAQLQNAATWWQDGINELQNRIG